MNVNELHPSLRNKSTFWLSTRSSWFSFFFPAEERVIQWGDIQMRGREVDYQDVLTQVPCPTVTDANGNGRYCAFAGADLDAYRSEVRRWLACFDEQGNKVATWVPTEIPVTVPLVVVAGPSR